jgi:hypothetical protein
MVMYGRSPYPLIPVLQPAAVYLLGQVLGGLWRGHSFQHHPPGGGILVVGGDAGVADTGQKMDVNVLHEC